MKQFVTFIGLAALCAASAFAGTVPFGFISWDVNFPGNAGQFDISNLTGANDLPPDFPISTTVDLSSLTLKVDFSNGSSQTFGTASGYFSLASDGHSFNGNPIAIGGTNPKPIDATLTGTFSTTSVSLTTGGGPVTILPTFTATFADSPTLIDGDLALILATTGTVSAVPEPASLAMLGIGIAFAIGARRKSAGAH